MDPVAIPPGTASWPEEERRLWGGNSRVLLASPDVAIRMRLGRRGMQGIAEDQPCAGAGEEARVRTRLRRGPGGSVSLNYASTARALMARGTEWRQGEGSSWLPCRDLGVVHAVAVNQNDHGLSSGISDP